jgi:hypothetical protein
MKPITRREALSGIAIGGAAIRRLRRHVAQWDEVNRRFERAQRAAKALQGKA